MSLENARNRQNLEQVAECFVATFEKAPVGIAHVGIDGRFLRVNPRFCSIVGYTRDEMLRRTFQEITHPDDLRVDLAHLEQLHEGEIDTYSLDKRYLHSGGEIVWVRLTVSALREDDGQVEIYIAMIDDITERKLAEGRLQVYQQRLKALASQLTIAEERERRRIATELHDTVSQSLALARVQIATAQGSLAEGEASRVLEGLSSSLLQAIKVTRQLMSDLSPAQIKELGLSAAISEWLDDEVGAKHGLDTAYHAAGGEPELSDDLKALLFRNVRELLTNVVKHAQAHEVSVRLQRTAVDVTITVQDDGIGFDPASTACLKPDEEGGFGLFSIEERMADLGGSLQIESSSGNGTTATLRLPGGEPIAARGSA